MPVLKQTQAQAHRFDRLRCNQIWDKACPTSVHICNYRDVFQIPRYPVLDGLTREPRKGQHLLWFASFPVGYPDFIEVEHSVSEAAMHRLLHAADGFIEENPRNLEARMLLRTTSRLHQFRQMAPDERLHPTACNWKGQIGSTRTEKARACPGVLFLEFLVIQASISASQSRAAAGCRPRCFARS
jgi:hypothetical protein